MKKKNNEQDIASAQPQETSAQKDSRMTNLLVIFMAVIFIILSAIILFVPQIEIKPEYLSYAVGTAIIIAGIVQIVRYFVTDAYRNINAYGFSTGTLFVILGVCALLRADVVGGVIDLVLGIAVLLMGIIMLQHSLDLKRMSDAVWGLVIILATLVIVCGVMLMIKPIPEKIDYAAYVWWIVLVSSALGLIVNIYTLIRVAIFKHKEKKNAARELKEREQAISAAASATAAAEAAAAAEAEADANAVSQSEAYNHTGITPYLEADVPTETDMVSYSTTQTENASDIQTNASSTTEAYTEPTAFSDDGEGIGE